MNAIAAVLEKTPSGVQGLDAIMGGGLPKGRPTLVAGRAGCGKTVLAMEFLVRGAIDHGEPGVFMCFEESALDLHKNFASFGYDLAGLVERKLLIIDHVLVERSQIEEAGDYDLDGLFIRLGYAIDQIGAKRVVLDTIESLFSGLTNLGILRSELRRLFQWLKDREVTTVVTGEAGDGLLVTRQGLEEYVSDCVIFLDHRVDGQRSTRRLRVVKYRGSAHGANEYPFIIDAQGVWLMPITAIRDDYPVSTERATTGVERLDAMLGGEGYFRGSSVLISGTAGTGKTTLAAHFATETCRRGRRCLFLAFEETPSQIIRNMRSVGIDLQPWVDLGLLRLHAARPVLTGIEKHLLTVQNLVRDFAPEAVITDPITSMFAIGTGADVQGWMTRLVDYLKGSQATLLATTLTHESSDLQSAGFAVSSLMDTWLMLRYVEVEGERNRMLTVVKSRGMAHSNQMREYEITSTGVHISDVYVGPGDVLTGSARAAQEARDRAAGQLRQDEILRKRRDLARRKKAVEAQIVLLRTEYEADEEALRAALQQGEAAESTMESDQARMATLRSADMDEADGTSGRL